MLSPMMLSFKLYTSRMTDIHGTYYTVIREELLIIEPGDTEKEHSFYDIMYMSRVPSITQQVYKNMVNRLIATNLYAAMKGSGITDYTIFDYLRPRMMWRPQPPISGLLE